MSNFVFIYYNGADPASKPPVSDDEREAVKKAWGGWFAEIGDQLVDGGNPFNYNGMFVESDNVDEVGDNWPATGYSIVKADSMDEAVKLAQGCPALKEPGEFSVRVFEALPM